MLRRLGPRRDRGAGLAEYAGLVVLAALILGALVALGLPAKVESGVSSAICQIFQGTNCGKPEAGGQNPGGQNPGDQRTGGQNNGGQNNGGQNNGGQNNGGPNNGNQNPNGNGPSLADLQKNADNAQKAADDANGKYGNIKQQIIDLLKDFIGITDIEDCISKGSISSCLWAAFDVASWVFAALKIAKFAKAVKDAIKLYKVFNKGRKIIDRAKDAAKRAKALLKKREAACALPNSFVAGTPVVMADGRSRPIEAVHVGDRVRAIDPRTGRARSEPVLATIRGHGVKHLVRIRVSTDPYGLSYTAVTATDNHPFWSPYRHSWVEAAHLRLNEVLAVQGRQQVHIAGLRSFTRTTTAYNLTVADLHTYQVRPSGDVQLPVHNINGECDRVVGGQKLSNSRIRHIWDRHVRRNINTGTEKFNTTNQSKLLKMIDKTIKQGTKKRGRFPGRSEYTLDYGHAIGRTSSGEEVTEMTVVVERGKIITAFPVKPVH